MPTVAPVREGARQLACAGCAMRPLCAAVEAVPGGVPAVETRQRLARGDALFQAGAPQSSLFAVRAGFLKVTAPDDGQELHVVRFVLPGDALGLEGFGTRRFANAAVALEDCEVCEIPLRRVQALSDGSPKVASHLRQLLSRELAQAQAHAATLAHRSAPQRMAGFLAGLATRWSERGYSALSFRLPMDRRELADYLGLTIETVSRLFTEFRQRGWVSVQGRRVTIHDLDALHACPRAP